MSYEPYEPAGASPDEPAPQDTPSYDVYDPQPEPAPPPADRPVPGRRSTMRTAVGGSRSTTHGPGGARVLGGVVAAVAAVAGIVAGISGSSSDDVGPGSDSGRYAACAAEHDESASLFTDEEWCDLELNGGDGDGVFDEAPYDDDDPFGEDDPYGFDDDPFTFDDPAGPDFP